MSSAAIVTIWAYRPYRTNAIYNYSVCIRRFVTSESGYGDEAGEIVRETQKGVPGKLRQA